MGAADLSEIFFFFFFLESYFSVAWLACFICALTRRIKKSWFVRVKCSVMGNKSFICEVHSKGILPTRLLALWTHWVVFMLESFTLHGRTHPQLFIVSKVPPLAWAVEKVRRLQGKLRDFTKKQKKMRYFNGCAGSSATRSCQCRHTTRSAQQDFTETRGFPFIYLFWTVDFYFIIYFFLKQGVRGKRAAGRRWGGPVTPWGGSAG